MLHLRTASSLCSSSSSSTGTMGVTRMVCFPSVVAPNKISATITTTAARRSLVSSSTSSSVGFSSLRRVVSPIFQQQKHYQQLPWTRRKPSALFLQGWKATTRRALSTDGGGGGDKAKTTKAKSSTDNKNNPQDEDNNELMLTPGEKVVAYSRLTLWFGIGIFASVCAYYIGKELMPTKMSPNRVFDRSFAIVKQDPEVLRRYGPTLKAYGRDHGGHREGRRNFIEHTEYTSQDDGSKRTRVRYNLQGPHGAAFVFAEVSNQMPSGEFVYIVVQDKSNGRVWTVQDQRAALTTQRLAGGNAEAQSAMAQLLSGGGKK